MKKIWYSTYESIKGPLVMYLIAMILLAIPNIFTSTNEILATILVAFQYAGGLVKTLFPLLVIRNQLSLSMKVRIP